MYCPKCGQSVSDNTRFCSRCGLPLIGLPEWVAGGATLAAPVEPTPLLPLPLSPRRKGMRRGAKLMFISAVLFPIFLGMALAADHPLPLIIPFTVFFAGLSVLLYSRLFGEETPTPKSQPARPAPLGAARGGAALPPAPHPGFGGFGDQRARTAELAQPPSVTENTTRLLDNE